jgi:ribosomal-protein-alanine N-acetyltransferase
MIAAPPIRLALPSDALRISELSRDAIEYGLPWSWTPRRVRTSVRDAATNVAVAGAQELLGFGIMKYGDEDAHLLLLAVASSSRRHGVGTALLRWLEESARVCGLRAIHLELRRGNTTAQAFYARHGYTRTGWVAGYYQGVEDAVQMAKMLRTAPEGSSGPARLPR